MEEIIKAIAFYEQYPTFEMYHDKNISREISIGCLIGLAEEQVVGNMKYNYEEKTTIAKVALANGYKGLNDI